MSGADQGPFRPHRFDAAQQAAGTNGESFLRASIQRSKARRFLHAVEAWLALYHDKRLFIAKAGDSAERGPKYAPTAASCAAQTAHLARLKKVERYPGHTFTGPADLAKYIA